MSSNRHKDGWENISTSTETGKKVKTKLKRNADNLDEDEEEQSERNSFRENSDFFPNCDD